MSDINVFPEELIKLSRSELIERVQARELYNLRISKEECEESLAEFIKQAWHIVEPANLYVHNWHIDFITHHLEAVTSGEITRLLINVPPGAMKPVHVDELVVTKAGPKRLGDINIGDMILTHRGRFRACTAVHEQGVLPLLSVRTASGRAVRTAPDHPFLTTRGWVQAKDLKVGDYAGTPHRVEDLQSSEMSPEEARLLGYLVGDGCISQRSLSFVNMEPDVLEDFIYCAKAVGFHAYLVDRHPNKKVRASKVVLKSATERWSRKGEEQPILSWLKKHGLYKSDSYTKRIPPSILCGGETVLRNFIGAYWSCDGCFSIRHSNDKLTMLASATTVSQGLSEDLLLALSLLNIQARARIKKRKLKSYRQPGGTYTSYDVQTTRRNEVAKFINMPGLCARKNEIVSASFRDEFDPVIYEDEIVEVSPAGEGVCRCLTVEKDSSFTAGGLIVHNSLIVNVFWPSWEWMKSPQTRYLCTSHSQNLAIRDSTKMRRLVTSEWYKSRWGEVVELTGDQNAKTKFENTQTGFREAVAFQSLTGVRADRVTIDDPHSVDSAMSDVQRQSTIETFLEAVPTRLTNPKKSAIVVIMQRLHTEDVSGVILDKNLGYEHIMLPMEFDPDRRCATSLGFEDPRETEGELLFPARFPREVVERDKQVMGPWASAGQLQQAPTPRGGGIIKRSYWQLWDDAEAQAQGLMDANKYPPMDYIIASLDPAYTEKKENDPSALTVWGVWQKGGASARRLLSRNSEVMTILDDRDTIPCVMLMHAWEKRLPIHGSEVVREQGENARTFRERQLAAYGLVEHVIETCNKYNVDMLLIEAKASGLSVSQEIKRLNRTATWGVYLSNPGNLDKVARAYAVQPIFANGAIYAPDKDWADKVITQAETFPKAKHDDFVDSTTQALKYLRERNFLKRPEEISMDIKSSFQGHGKQLPVYDV